MEIENYSIEGMRGKDFKLFIQSLLELSCLESKYIERLLEPEKLKFYEKAFTHSSCGPDNYEFYELLGDATCNKIIVWYLKDRFPFLNRAEDVKVLSRLKIMLVSGKNFSKIAQRFDFERYISYDLETKVKHHKSVLEDCFEAFFGVTELVVNQEFHQLGYLVCFSIMKHMLDEINISLCYTDLYDPITRLKETFDYYNSTSNVGTCSLIWGQLKFEAKKNMEDGFQYVKLLQKTSHREELLLSGYGSYLDEVKQKLCEQYLEILQKRGFQKPISNYYREIEEKYKNPKQRDKLF